MENTSPCLTKTDVHAVMFNSRVRRLLPVECERLQGMPDHYTKVLVNTHSRTCAAIVSDDFMTPCDCGYTVKASSDSARYQAIGNSMAVPVIRWLGKRVEREIERNARVQEHEEI